MKGLIKGGDSPAEGEPRLRETDPVSSATAGREGRFLCGGARSTKGLQQPVTCGAELLLRSTTRVGSRASRREHPHVPTPLSSGWTEAESPQRPKPIFSLLPGLIHSQHPQPHKRSDENESGPIRARVTSVHLPIRRRLIASAPPPAARPLTGRQARFARSRASARSRAPRGERAGQAEACPFRGGGGGERGPPQSPPGPGAPRPMLGAEPGRRAAARPAPAR